MISTTLGALIFSVLIESHLTSVRIYQLQRALMNIQSNALRATFLLKTTPISKFRISKTSRRYADGTPIYSLYMEDHHRYKEMVEGVTALNYQIDKSGIDIKIQLISPPIAKNWYLYVAFN